MLWFWESSGSLVGSSLRSKDMSGDGCTEASILHPCPLAPPRPAFVKQWMARRKGRLPGSSRNLPTDRCGN